MPRRAQTVPARPWELRLTLPLPPSVNRVWRQGKGRTYLDATVRDYRLAVEAAIRAQLPRHKPLSCGLHLSVTLYMQRRKCDEDNRAKALRDALTHAGLWVDDVQICSSDTTRRMDSRNPRVELTLWEIADPALLDAWNAQAA